MAVMLDLEHRVLGRPGMVLAQLSTFDEPTTIRVIVYGDMGAAAVHKSSGRIDRVFRFFNIVL
jgi:hypothetical protein